MPKATQKNGCNPHDMCPFVDMITDALRSFRASYSRDRCSVVSPRGGNIASRQMKWRENPHAVWGYIQYTSSALYSGAPLGAVLTCLVGANLLA